MMGKEAYEVKVPSEYLTRYQKMLINCALGMYCRVGLDLLDFEAATNLSEEIYAIRQWLIDTPTAKDESEIL